VWNINLAEMWIIKVVKILYVNMDDVLVDFDSGITQLDRQTTHGVDKFIGEHIHFGSAKFPDWPSVLNHLLNPQNSTSPTMKTQNEPTNSIQPTI
jgi:hypothetical protein